MPSKILYPRHRRSTSDETRRPPAAWPRLSLDRGNRLNEPPLRADVLSMTPNAHVPAAPPAAEGTTLLPARDALLAHLDERLPLTVRTSATLMVVGLLRCDDGRPTAPSTVTAVTALLAQSLRGDDYLATSGPGEFVVVLSGSPDAAVAAAERLVTSVAALGIDGLTASAGIAPLTPEVTASEVLRRGLVSLTSARRAGAGTVIRHREPY
jgi:GGDEF domain-containing protein